MLHEKKLILVSSQRYTSDRPVTPVTHCYTSDWVSQLTVGLLSVGLFYWTAVMKQLNANQKTANLSSIFNHGINRDRLSQSQNSIKLSQGRYLAGSFLFLPLCRPSLVRATSSLTRLTATIETFCVYDGRCNILRLMMRWLHLHDGGHSSFRLTTKWLERLLTINTGHAFFKPFDYCVHVAVLLLNLTKLCSIR